MPKQEIKICSECGAKKVVYTFGLTNGIVGTLKKFAKAVKKYGRNKIHYENEAFLTHKQGCNISKLGNFKLLEMVEKKSGYWKMTPLAFDFLNNRASLPKHIKVYRGEVKEESEERVFFSDFPEPDSLYWQEEYKMENPDFVQGSPQQRLL